MSKDKPVTILPDGGPDVTSAGVNWNEVPEFAQHYVAWIDGRHGSAQAALPPIDAEPVPKILYRLPALHPDRPTGSKAMLDAHGARARLAGRRAGAWIISPFTGWKWAAGHLRGRYCLGVGKPAPINCSLLRVGAALRKKSWGAGEKRYPPSSDQHCNRLQKPNPGRASGPFCGWDAALTPDNGASQQPLSDGFQRPNALDLGSDCRIDVLSIPVSLQT